MNESSSSQIELSQEIAASIEAGDMDRAHRLLNDLGAEADPRIVAAVAGVSMRQCRWQEALATFDRINNPNDGCQMQMRLAQNLQALQQARPEVYRVLLETSPQTLCEISSLPSGKRTVTQTTPDGQKKCLSRSADPTGDAHTLTDSMAAVIDRKNALLLGGVSDGYLLKELAGQFARIDGDLLPILYIVEPDPEVVINCMMLHDMTGPHGPVECVNYHWYVGPGWEDSLRKTLVADPLMPGPATSSFTGRWADTIKACVHEISERNTAPNQDLVREVKAYYDGLTCDKLVDLLGPTPPRQPRMIVLTSRFTTVLQYSSRDVADAFEKLGWQIRIIIEPTPTHRVTFQSMLRDLHDFKPDMVFVIDHLRYQIEDLFPPNLPYVCWIQDVLPNLTSTTAGESIGLRDFVLTSNRPTYRDTHGYPDRQCIDLAKLSRPPHLPASWASNGDDLVYVSNASRTGEQWADKIVAGMQDDPRVSQLIRTCCDRILQVYRAGGSIDASYQVLKIVEQVEHDLDMHLVDPTVRFSIVMKLVHPLNDALYRQQALGWAANVTQRLGLTLAIYGNGWADHPTLAPYARGPVAYGNDLEELTRASKINLRLEPYTSLGHQRMIDGLLAGGFFLHRHFRPETELQHLCDFLHEHLDPSVNTLSKARAQIDPEYVQELEQRVGRCSQLFVELDSNLVDGVRALQNCGVLASVGEALPRLAEMSFHDEDSLQHRVEQLINKPDVRQQVATSQRRMVEQSRTYVVGIQGVINKIRRLIDEEPASVTSAPLNPDAVKESA
jgi:hypothetical protein